MKKSLNLISAMLLIGGVFTAAILCGPEMSVANPSNHSPIHCCADPMHTSHSSDTPGLTPHSLMMEPVYVEEEGRSPAGRMRLAVVGQNEGTAQGKAKDPVCGMNVDREGAESRGMVAEYQGKTYYFCSHPCRRLFQNDPERFLKTTAPEAPSGTAR